MHRIYTFLLLVFSLFAIQGFGQTQDTLSFNADIGLTNNGISNVPNFSLNKPAITSYLSFTRGRFSFDPQIHFSTEFKPWQNSYWLHYKLIDQANFKMRTGTGLNFSYDYGSVIADGVQKSLITGHSYFNADLSADYTVNKYLTISPIYLYGKGREKSGAGYLHYVALVTNFQNIDIGSQLKMAISPQIYHVLLDGLNGDFFSTNLALQSKQSPFSISAMMNTPIGHSNTLAADFVWSLCLHLKIEKQFLFKK